MLIDDYIICIMLRKFVIQFNCFFLVENSNKIEYFKIEQREISNIQWYQLKFGNYYW